MALEHFILGLKLALKTRERERDKCINRCVIFNSANLSFQAGMAETECMYSMKLNPSYQLCLNLGFQHANTRFICRTRCLWSTDPARISLRWDVNRGPGMESIVVQSLKFCCLCLSNHHTNTTFLAIMEHKEGGGK
ncbi:Hypothetical predicted protein [Podarcis lilfordi]|uniref:Uncharacterized protein n=1 Tax=Podarcis lilfordi TaxID=74358 RepID=A0AA35JWA9_9SAUR|nr:Hypothetical predicted protein [Podarcis lilfordi]